MDGPIGSRDRGGRPRGTCNNGETAEEKHSSKAASDM
jgi:hypothetical protein